jgi:hypothetical protein
MARTSVTSQKVVHAGILPALTAPAGTGPSLGDVIDGGFKTLIVACGATGTVVTVESPVIIDGLALTNLSVTVAANTTVHIGPFNQATFGQTSASATQAADVGRVYVDYSSITTVTRGVTSY